MSAGLTVSNLIAGYGKQVVLNQINLAAGRGEITVLLGPNGSGKTTLLRTICGIVRPHSGSVFLGQENLLRMRPMRRAKHVAYVPQLGHSFNGGLTVFETVAQGVPRELPRKKRFEVTAMVLERLGLIKYGLRPASAMSGGQRQRIVIGRALAQGTPFLCLDEPFSNLDVYYQVGVIQLLREFAAEGVGVLVVVHDITAAARLADQVILLYQGSVAAADIPGTVLEEETLRKVYQTDFDIFCRAGSMVVLAKV